MGDAFIYKHGSSRMERGTILICIFSIFSIFVQDVPSDELVVQDVPGTEENSDEIVVRSLYRMSLAQKKIQTRSLYRMFLAQKKI